MLRQTLSVTKQQVVLRKKHQSRQLEHQLHVLPVLKNQRLSLRLQFPKQQHPTLKILNTQVPQSPAWQRSTVARLVFSR
jgi:hypothetical protein